MTISPPLGELANRETSRFIVAAFVELIGFNVHADGLRHRLNNSPLSDPGRTWFTQHCQRV